MPKAPNRGTEMERSGSGGAFERARIVGESCSTSSLNMTTEYAAFNKHS